MPNTLRIPIAAVVAALSLAFRLPADDFDAVREAFLAQINADRVSGGASPLSLSQPLSRLAQEFAEEAARRGNPDLVPPDPKEAVRRAGKAGYSPKALAEIFTRADGDVEEVIRYLRQRAGDTWRGLSSDDFRDLGVGVAILEDVPLYVFVLGVSWEEFTAGRAEAYRDLPAMRREMIERVNAERRARRLPRLHPSTILDRIAQSYAEDMLKRSYYGHESPEGQTVRERAIDGGYLLTAVGENVASGQPTVADVMDGWMRSEEHRRNILSKVFLDVGFGVAVGKNREGFQIIWVQVFGRPRAAFD